MQREKVCAVIGLARAGVPAARFLAERGARVLGYDSRPLEELSDEARALVELGVELHTGDHKFARIKQGNMIVLSPGLKIHHPPLQSIVRDAETRGVEVIGELELAARHCPAPMIAVTGTKGKSTTVKLIADMLQACGINAIRAGNTGVPLIAELPRLSPDAWAVVEVSSFQLERAPTFKPHIAVLLNLLADHLDYHPSLEQYWGTKLKLFARQNKNDIAILNIDNDPVRELWEGRGTFPRWHRQLKSQDYITTAQATPPTAQWCVVCRRGDQLGFQGLPFFMPIIDVADIPLRGEHNWSNVAAAMAAAQLAADEAKIDDKTSKQAIAETIRNFESLPHRLEVIGQIGEITWVNDSQATIPDAAVRALGAFAPPVTLIAGGRAKLQDAAAFDELGQAIARQAHLLITIGEASKIIADAAVRAGFDAGRIIDAKTLDQAVLEAARQTPAGGTVVLSPACASFDQFASFEARGAAFRAAVEALQNK
ncbi:MAG: UDP-N-acetylmuramoyl-L-alanine--D-glutamate ligase [Abitibacteriaceae bacterium]|nr:UDP-N-acetylmuramoyl-L-alanine--D-glutamate ligase [Abditibacteriaceae bacterium]MBV9865920.1 UDP-N-acetylmuramoyl-L-alanine--D-glutamate ligase [Abditibacteriaceae bacterium]